MNITPNIAIEITKILTDFLSENRYHLILLFLLIAYRVPISNVISRLISFTFKKGNSELAVKASAPIYENDAAAKNISDADEKPAKQDEDEQVQDKTKDEGWFSEMYSALDSGDLEAAETAFKKYALDEKDEVKLEENKAIYLFLKYEKGGDNFAIDELEELVQKAKTDESKFNSLTWLSICLSDSMQYKKDVKVWENAISEIESEPFKSKAIVNLAYAMDKDNESIKARQLLIKRLLEVKEDNLKAGIYKALSKIENTLGNKTISIYCKDKCLEYDPNNKTELFNSAYDASNEDIDDISISNYLRLVRIDGKNSTAFNNLGVRAQEAGLKIKAVENYKKAAGLENTLAMANQGYLLLASGFTEDADKIAKKALALEDTHKNVHSLIAAIDKKKEDENKEWEKLSDNSLRRQELIRTYTEQYYLGSPKSLQGEWFVNGITKIKIEIYNDKLEATWEELASALEKSNYSVKLTGKVSGSTFSGQYTKRKIGDSTKTVLGFNGNISNDCIGFLSNGVGDLILIATKIKSDFTLRLTKVPHPEIKNK